MRLVVYGAAMVALWSAASAAHAASDTQTYAQHLADLERARHPQIVTLTAEPSDKPSARRDPSPAGPAVVADLLDVSRDPIGVLAFTFKTASAQNTAVVKSVQAAMARKLISAKNGLDPYPYDPAYSEGTYAQALVDRTVARHPEIIILAIHSTPPGSPVNVITGSTIGRIGKKADEDDLRVIEKGATNLEVAENGKRFEVEAPLNDARGHRIGALGVVFRYRAGDDKEALRRRGLAIRDEMARQIPDAAALARPR